MPEINQKPLTKLTDLQVNEVSLVDRGAIGEVFTVIKSEDPESGKDLINKVTVDQITEHIKAMSNEDFAKIMSYMMDTYKSINKQDEGGSNDMDEQVVKDLIADAVGKAMETVNKNFSQINKSIDEIQKAAKPAEMTDEEKQKLAQAQKDEAVKKSEQEKKLESITDAVAKIADSVKGVADAVGTISKGLEGVTAEVKKVSELKDSVAEVTKRLEEIEKVENPTNDASKGEDTIKKSAGNTGSKWPSFVAKA